LTELGYKTEKVNLRLNKRLCVEQYPKILLYEAQKWLREEKKIIIEITFNLMYKGQSLFRWRVLYNLTQHKGSYYTFDSVKSKEDYDSYEEAFSEAIKEAVKILAIC
jgi:hypothetical protein